MINTAVASKNGTTIILGKSIAHGGEGEVYEVSRQQNLVAKLYFEPLDKEKQEKLRFMAEASTDALTHHTAWPQQTLHRGENIVGFLMPKLTDFWPIHELYSPQSRMQNFPGQRWDMLLFSARNAAAAFSTLHDAGFVIGDVNERNLMVNQQAQVRLIDCDSFQFDSLKHTFICKTGVDIWTPPELQDIKSFSDIKRTQNHDLFGLALVIFQLLFSGRHPYAGVPISQKPLGDGLPWKIKNFHFAYAENAAQRGVTRPPATLPLSFVPQEISRMFEKAFIEVGVAQRPKADEWVKVLDFLYKNLSRCTASSAHVYPNHLRECPWCSLEHRSGIVYFIVKVDSNSLFTQSDKLTFEIQQFVARINALLLPNFSSSFSTSPHSVQPIALPRGAVAIRKFFNILKFVACLVLTVSLLSAQPKHRILYIASTIGCVLFLHYCGNRKLYTERDSRNTRKNDAQQNFDRYSASWKQIGSQFYSTFDVNSIKSNHLNSGRHNSFIRTALSRQKVENIEKPIDLNSFPLKIKLDESIRQYEKLPEEERRQLEILQRNLQKSQLLAHLQKFSLAYANIKNIGTSRKAELRSFGIFTAADITQRAILSVPGFGPARTDLLLRWRAECERKFVFNPKLGVGVTERNTVQQAIFLKKKELEREMQIGLKKLEDQIIATNLKLDALRPVLANSARELAQAKADYDAIASAVL